MTVHELCEKTGFSVLSLPQPERQIEGGYAGDLLSWVMGNATHGCAWVTIMTNRNIIAVASLIEMSCIVLAEGCTLSEELLQLANTQNINILSSPLGAYDTCAAISRLL